MKNAKKMMRNSAKADRKHAAGLFMAIALMAALLAACGFGKKIYEDDRLNAMITEADGRIDLSVRIRSSAVPMQEKIREKLTAGEPISMCILLRRNWSRCWNGVFPTAVEFPGRRGKIIIC